MLLVLSLGFPTLLHAQREATAIEIKAAFLLKFPGYVEWAGSAFATPNSPLLIGVVDDAIAANLEQISRGQLVDGHPLQIRRLQPWEDPAGLHVLFIGQNSLDAAGMLLRDAAMKGVLTVTDTNAALPAGSIINFLVIDDHVRFEVELSTAAQSGLRLSSRLLQVARNVIGSPP